MLPLRSALKLARSVSKGCSQHLPSRKLRPPCVSFSTKSALSADIDMYGGVVIKEHFVGLSTGEFEQKLSHSLQVWKEDSRRGVWLRIPIDSSGLIPVAVKLGFQFHHCREDYILLCNWIDPTSSSRLPRGPSHYIGVAGFVMNSNNELLMIKEKDGPAKARDLWKLPGGLLDRAENIETGVVREVFEETGLSCQFQRLAAIVESHNGTGPMRESSSDLYCISVLKLTTEDQVISPQMEEIEACEWVPIEKALALPLYAEGAVFGECFRSAFAVRNKCDNEACHSTGLVSETFPIGFGNRVGNILYSKKH